MQPSLHLVVRGLIRAGIVAGGALLALAASQTHALADTGPAITGIPITTTSCSSCVSIAPSTGASLQTKNQPTGGLVTAGAARGNVAIGGTEAGTNAQTAATGGAGLQTNAQTSAQILTSGTVDHTGSVSTTSGMATSGTEGQTNNATNTTTVARAASGVTVPERGQNGVTVGSPPSCQCTGPVSAPQGTVSVDVKAGTQLGTPVSESTTVTGSAQIAEEGSVSTSITVRTSGTADIGGTETQPNTQTAATRGTDRQSTTQVAVVTSGGDYPAVGSSSATDTRAATEREGATRPAVHVTTLAGIPTRTASDARLGCPCRQVGTSASADRAVSGPPLVEWGGSVSAGMMSPTSGPLATIRNGSGHPGTRGVNSGTVPAVPSIHCPCDAGAVVPPGPGVSIQPSSASRSRLAGERRPAGCEGIAYLPAQTPAVSPLVIVLAGRVGSDPTFATTAGFGGGGRLGMGAPGGAGAASPDFAPPRLSMPWKAPPFGVTLLPVARGTSPPG